ncbi:MAG: ArsR/SmtB family transcription factor [Halorientalis sp.]
MSLLPSSKPDVDAGQGEPRLLGLDDEETDDVVEAISSETARALLARIHEEPRTPSELAEATDNSIQNVSYHLENLEAAGLVRVADTRYSEKGAEMDVYAPADEPLVMFVGPEERKRSVREILAEFVGATALLAVVSIVVHTLVEERSPYLSFTGAGDAQATGTEAGGGAAGDAAARALSVEPVLPLATTLFLGGFAVLVLAFAWRYWEPEIRDLRGRIANTALLGGRDRSLSRRAGRLGAGGFVVAAVGWFAVAATGTRVPGLGPVDPALALGLVLVVAAAVQAYYNDGLLVSWFVVFGPVAGFALGLFASGFLAGGAGVLVGAVGYAVVVGTVAALVFGTGGFLVGAGCRRLVARVW